MSASMLMAYAGVLFTLWLEGVCSQPAIVQLLWRDDFTPCKPAEAGCYNGGIRASNWRAQEGPAVASVWGAKQECYQTGTDVLDVLRNPDNRTDGILRITMIKTPKVFLCQGRSPRAQAYRQFKTGALNSQGLQSFVWQRTNTSYRSLILQVYAKMARDGNGLWCGFWMRPNVRNNYGQWPRDGEIDIYEHIKASDTVAQTLHFRGVKGGDSLRIGRLVVPTAMTAFHLYTLEWSPLYIRFYVDGQMSQEVPRSVWNAAYRGFPPTAPFDVPFHMRTKMSVGGVWSGTPDETTSVRSFMEIDFVQAGYGPVMRLPRSPLR